MQNFKGIITRKKCKSKNFTRKTYGNISDFILFYTKTEEPVWNRPYEAWDDEKILKEYPYIEEGTGRRYKKVPVHAPGTRNGATGMPWRGMMPPEGKHWQFTPDKLDEMDANGEMVIHVAKYILTEVMVYLCRIFGLTIWMLITKIHS